MDSNALFQQAMQHYSNQNTAAAVDALTQAAELKHPMATLYLAEHYYRTDEQRALTFLRQQSARGVLGALHRLATLNVFFINHKMSLQDALDLHHEAVNGHVESALIMLDLTQAQQVNGIYFNILNAQVPKLLEDLGCNQRHGSEVEDMSDKAIAHELSQAVDAFNHRVTATPSLEIAGCNVRLFKRMLSPIACQYFKLRLGHLLQPSMVHDPVTGKGIKHDVRTSDIVHVTPEHIDWFTLELDWLIENITGDKRARGESFNLLRYDVSQEYKPHYDAIVGQGPHFEKIMQDGGQRVRTAITYLSDDFDGGSTQFPKLQISIKPDKGDILVFDNLMNDGNVLRDSYHAGAPVTKGTKWVLTKWIRERTTHYGNVVYPTRSK